jgi:two-component system, LytTR family, sensor histidine kinase AlgZ
MHPILSNRRTLILYLTVWLSVGLLIEIPFLIPYKSQWVVFLLSDMPLNILFAFICLSSYYLCRIFPINTTRWYNLLSMFLVAACIASALELIFGYGWIHLIDSLSIASPISTLYEPWIAGIFSTLVLIFLLVASMHYVIIGFERSNESERQTFELKLLAQDAELRALRAQIDPHFLFNSLNSISALTASDPHKARTMTLLLADFFRKSLEFGARNHIPLDDELSLINDFLTIEQVRFGSRLKIEQDVMEECRRIFVPPLILQPLVENAVRHGIAHLVNGGTIRMECKGLGERIVIQIENPVDPERLKRKGTGLGLKNVRLRLDTLYGNDSRVDVEESNEYFRVILSFPCHRGS